MNFRRFLLTALLLAAALVLTAPGYVPAVNAHQDTKTGTTTGFATGTVCKKSGTYRATNNKIENVIVVAEGEVFPPFSDGAKTVWYLRTTTTKN